jgi:hypothetical protein
MEATTWPSEEEMEAAPSLSEEDVSNIVAMLSERTGNMNGRDTWRMAENGKRKGTEIGETSGRLLRRVCWQDRQEKEGEGRRRT